MAELMKQFYNSIGPVGTAISSLLFIVLLLYLGFKISQDIELGPKYLIFWILYIITLFTIFNISFSIYAFLQLAKKNGSMGEKGDTGARGESGGKGKCDFGCLNKFFEDDLIKYIEIEINKHAGNPNPSIKLINFYIIDKIIKMVESEDFKRFSLKIKEKDDKKSKNIGLEYLKSKWKIWIGLIYDAGGRAYFETLGGTEHFDWIGQDPFQEIKRDDVFYWGLGDEYMPKNYEKCNVVMEGFCNPTQNNKNNTVNNKNNKNNTDDEYGWY
jgi:hypothetical protein